MKNRSIVCVLLLCVPISTVSAQRQRQSAGRVAVREELAATLLAANRLDEAAAEYRRLLAVEPNNREFRLGLARALAWSNHPREAERELLLARTASNASTVDALLRGVRPQFDATPAQAISWMHESPDYLPYRLSLARALARDAPNFAVAQYDTLRMASRGTIRGSGELPSTAVLMSEQAHALLDDKQPAAARAELDTVIAMSPTVGAYTARASANLALHDTVAAERDLQTSLAAAPSYDAYYLMAAVSRNRDDYVNSRKLYDAARRLTTDNERRDDVDAAEAELSRTERPVLDFVPSLVDDPGWRVGGESATDNTGVSYASVAAHKATALPNGFSADVSVGERRIAQHDIPAPFATNGTDASLGLGYQAVSGATMASVAVRGGVLSHPGIATFKRAAVAASVWRDAWELGGELSYDPAYEALFSPSALTVPIVQRKPLTATSARVTTGGPLGFLDVAATANHTTISDGNDMNLVEARVRAPVDASSGVYATYSGTLQTFSKRSPLYWDPLHYTSNAIGPELRVQRTSGLSYNFRFLAGVAHSVEQFGDTNIVVTPPTKGRPARTTTTSAPLTKRWAAQIETGGEATYRAGWWEGAAGIVYSRARSGGYQRIGTSLTIRVLR